MLARSALAVFSHVASGRLTDEEFDRGQFRSLCLLKLGSKLKCNKLIPDAFFKDNCLQDLVMSEVDYRQSSRSSKQMIYTRKIGGGEDCLTISQSLAVTGSLCLWRQQCETSFAFEANGTKLRSSPLPRFSRASD